MKNYKQPLIIMHDDEQYFSIAGACWDASYQSVNTPAKLIKCVYHLSIKGDWITKEHLSELIRKCSDRFGYSIFPFNAYLPDDSQVDAHSPMVNSPDIPNDKVNSLASL